MTPGHCYATLKDARSVRRLLECCDVQWVRMPSDPPGLPGPPDPAGNRVRASISACSDAFDSQDPVERKEKEYYFQVRYSRTGELPRATDLPRIYDLPRPSNVFRPSELAPSRAALAATRAGIGLTANVHVARAPNYVSASRSSSAHSVHSSHTRRPALHRYLRVY